MLGTLLVDENCHYGFLDLARVRVLPIVEEDILHDAEQRASDGPHQRLNLFARVANLLSAAHFLSVQAHQSFELNEVKIELVHSRAATGQVAHLLEPILQVLS